MKDVAARSRELFHSGYFCAESVLMAVAEHQGIESPLIPRIATGFCGGMSRTSGLCGALTGGIMGLNIVFGRDSAEGSRDRNYAVVAQYIKDFEKQFGSVHCSDLLGCDLSTAEGERTFKDKNLLAFCARITEEATSLVMRLIEKGT